MDISSATIVAVSAAVAVPIFLGLMRSVRSVKNKSSSKKTLGELKEEYSGWEKLASFLLIIFAGSIGFAIWKGLSIVSSLQMSYVEPSKYLISQPSVTWALPALFIAIFLSAIPLHFMYLALLGRERYAEYTEYGNQKFGGNSWKLLRYIGYVIIPICLIFTFLSLNSYARVTNNTFVINRFFSLSEVQYNFEKIKAITLTKSFKAPNGKIVRKPYYEIGFTDGTSYNFHKALHDLNFAQQKEIVEHVSNNSVIRVVFNNPYPV